MSVEHASGESDNEKIALGAARFRTYLIRSTVRFATFWSALVLLGLVVGAVSFRYDLYGFAFSGFTGALAAAMMVWIAICQIVETRNESDRSILFLGPPRQVPSSVAAEKPQQPPSS